MEKCVSVNSDIFFSHFIFSGKLRIFWITQTEIQISNHHDLFYESACCDNSIFHFRQCYERWVAVFERLAINGHLQQKKKEKKAAEKISCWRGVCFVLEFLRFTFFSEIVAKRLDSETKWICCATFEEMKKKVVCMWGSHEQLFIKRTSFFLTLQRQITHSTILSGTKKVQSVWKIFHVSKLHIFKNALAFFCVGEVERLLKEYRQNQELVRKIGGHFYQIIYPVQLRHHEKMGISTREVGGSKVRFSLGKRNIMNSTVCQIIHSFIYSYTIKVLFIKGRAVFCGRNGP